MTDEGRVDLATGDTIVMPAHAIRQISTEVGATFVVTGGAAGLATPITADGEGTPTAREREWAGLNRQCQIETHFVGHRSSVTVDPS